MTLVTSLAPKSLKKTLPSQPKITLRRLSFVLRLDYLSCVLTITSTILVGRRCWEGWLVGLVNSVVICVIGIKTAQFGFIPANVFCIAISANNLRNWRRPKTRSSRQLNFARVVIRAIRRFSANGHSSSIHCSRHEKPEARAISNTSSLRVFVAALGPDGFAFLELDLQICRRDAHGLPPL